MLCTNIWLLSVSTTFFGALAVLFAIAACVLSIVVLGRDVARGSGWVWSALAATTFFAQLDGFANAACLGHHHLLAQLVSSAVLSAAGLALTQRYRAEALPL